MEAHPDLIDAVAPSFHDSIDDTKNSAVAFSYAFGLMGSFFLSFLVCEAVFQGALSGNTSALGIAGVATVGYFAIMAGLWFKDASN